MIKCICCKELIGITTMSYKISTGFIDDDGNFIEDAKIIIHADCSNDIEPFQELEILLKDN
tara:strand:- start:925 stop:1107 length:183 start_codon:yes stop_codon:yes gene_type:complete